MLSLNYIKLRIQRLEGKQCIDLDEVTDHEPPHQDRSMLFANSDIFVSGCEWVFFQRRQLFHVLFLPPFIIRGWSGGAMVLGKLPVPGRPTILITVGQGPIALAAGAGGGGLDIFTLIYPFSSFSLSLGDGSI